MPKGRKTNQLTFPQRAFVLALAQGLNQAEAYLKAFPKSIKWKSISRHVAASRLVKKPHVAKAYKEELARVQAVERENNDWTRAKSIKARLAFKEKIEQELERRLTATIAEAEALRQSPPKGKEIGWIAAEICRILQKPIISQGLASAYQTNLEGLDKAVGIDKEQEGANETILFVPWEEEDGEGED